MSKRPPGPESPFNPGQRPPGMSMVMAVPAIFAVLLLGALGLLVLRGQQDFEPTGARLEIRFATTCAAEAAPVIAARAEDIGLGEPRVTPDGSVVTLSGTMPGLPDDETAIPALLTRPGTFEARSSGTVVVDQSDITDASLDMDASNSPFTRVKLAPSARARLQAALDADPAGVLELTLDGERLLDRPNSVKLDDGDLRLITDSGQPRERARVAADRAIALSSGPLPCPVSVASVQPAASP